MMNTPFSHLIRTFFLLHRRFSIPALGTLFVKTDPAYHDFSNSLLYPSKELLAFKPEPEERLVELFRDYASEHGQIAHEETNAYLKSLKQDIRSGKTLYFEGIGSLRIENNTYQLSSEDLAQTYQPPVGARAVVHEGELHDITVGTDVRTNEEMKVLLADKKSKDYWWIYALILVLVAIGAIVYYVYFE